MPFEKSLLRKVAVLNGLIFVIVLLSVFSGYAAFAAGLVMVAWLTALAARRPREAFFIVFGIKLTFDALWHIKLFSLPGVGGFGLLHVFFLPVFLLIAIGPRLDEEHGRWLVVIPGLYVVWVTLAMLLNGRGVEVEMVLRQASIVIGVLLGYKYIRSREDLNRALVMIFASTVIPVTASLAQVLLGGSSLPIFHYTVSTYRGLRAAGLYYDSATAGMVTLLSVFTGLFLLNNRLVPERFRPLFMGWLPVCALVVVAGGTRSIMAVFAVGVVLLLVRNIRTAFLLLPLLLFVVWVGQPILGKVLFRSRHEVRNDVQIANIMTDKDYGRMFTGRVSLWQETWRRFNAGNEGQMLFGSGRTPNAHSTYFFLLLELGWLGLIYYLFFHGLLLRHLLRDNVAYQPRVLALVMLITMLMIGVSMHAVAYTSMQWIVYLIIASVLGNLAARPEEAAAVGARAVLAPGASAALPESAPAPAQAAVEEDGPEARPEPAAAAAAMPHLHPPMGDLPGLNIGQAPIRHGKDLWLFRLSLSAWILPALVPAAVLAALGLFYLRYLRAPTPTMPAAVLVRHAAPRGEGPRAIDVELPRVGVSTVLSPPAAPIEIPELPSLVEKTPPATPAPSAAPAPVPAPTPTPAPAPPPTEPETVREAAPPPIVPEAQIPALLRRGAAYFAEGRMKKAEETYLEAVDLDPMAFQAYFALGDLYLERGEFERAKRMYRMAEEIVRVGGAAE